MMSRFCLKHNHVAVVVRTLLQYNCTLKLPKLLCMVEVHHSYTYMLDAAKHMNILHTCKTYMFGTVCKLLVKLITKIVNRLPTNPTTNAMQRYIAR